MDNLLNDFNNISYKITILPLKCLQDIVVDIKNLKKNNQIGKLQKWVINEMYVLDHKGLDFKPKSIVLTAKRHDIKQIIFNYKGKQIKDYLSLFNPKLKETTLKIFHKHGYNIAYKYWLPSKRLAARAGLSEYGRNNITYIKGWGSFFEHASFFSDIEPLNDYTWGDVKCLELCEKCQACVKACPTSAIVKNRFMINPDLCISNFNEMGTEAFPDFIPKESHLSVVDCLICQKACPYNKKVLNEVNNIVEFTEAETELLLKGTALEKLPTTLKNKIDVLHMHWFYKSLPRNLKAMLYNAIERA